MGGGVGPRLGTLRPGSLRAIQASARKAENESQAVSSSGYPGSGS